MTSGFIKVQLPIKRPYPSKKTAGRQEKTPHLRKKLLFLQGLPIIHRSPREDKRESKFLTAILQIVHYAHISGISLGFKA